MTKLTPNNNGFQLYGVAKVLSTIILMFLFLICTILTISGISTNLSVWFEIVSKK